ncbi:hypothetical protein HZS61_002293 [Fusarium oxysporum f. sp. conglutinans]|uniref:HAT C-terminal dimerisation domain-containing protein n=1 Tax=Fusarium oxysporum f. sp. conglutinans TaxID=100902 RepID=A0A8H6GIK8_FUSOX|nr:hypothetical protein HZS61_002293 [Fusarium oxysporum f. sp. conglutinans]
MSSASPAPLLPEPSGELLGPASPGSPVPAKRTMDRSPSDRAGKRAKDRTNKSTWNEARGPYEERGEKARDTSYHEIWYCKHCDSTKKPNSITTNLSRARKHLRVFHGIRVIEHVERSDLKKQQHGTITDLFGRQEERQANRDLNEEKYLANAINIPAFEEALARLLAVRNIAHTFIEYPEFHAVIPVLSCNYMARDVLLRSRRAVPKLLKKTFAQHKQGLVKKLHNSLSSMVHFTIDIWTSSEQKAAYQAIVAFLEVVEEYDLKGKVGYFTMDNHDANDTMLDDIAKEIDGSDLVARRLRCSGHIMNLIVQAFLFRSKAKKIQEDEREGIDEAYQRLCRLSEREEGGIITKAQATEEWREFSVLGKLHNLCIYSRSSTSIYNDLKAEIGRALPRDNDTRWNSWFRLIDVAIEKRAKFMDWIQENHAKIEKDALDHNDWNELGDIHAFLQLFHQVSVRQGRENTLDEVLSHMDFLHHHFTQTKNRAFSGPRFYARFHVAWLKFEKYYQLTEQAPVYVAGILLHPALRKSYLSEQWKRNPAWVSNAVKAVRKIWSTEYKSYQLPDEQQEKGQELDEFDRWRQKVYSTASEVKDEFDRFIYVILGLDNDTRWNSWFLLLDAALDKEEHIKWYQDKYYDALVDDYLAPQDWQNLRETRNFLQPFWKITLLTEGYRSTLDRTLFTMDVLHKHYQQAFNKYKMNQQLLGPVLTSWHVFDKYYQLSDESPAYAAALILHPSRGKAHIQKNWPKAWHKKIFTGVKKLWEDEYKNLPTVYTTPSIVPALELDEYDLLAQELNVIGTEPDVDEYETYTSQPPIPIDCSPLVWWLRDEQKERFPRLSKMAIDILSIPAMSAGPERTFSGARRTISWDRMLLGASTIEKGECLKSWIRSGITAGLHVDEVEQYEYMAEEGSTSALEEDVGPLPV